MDPGRCLFTLENIVLAPGWDSYGGHHSSLLRLRLISSFEGSLLSDLPIFSLLRPRIIAALCGLLQGLFLPLYPWH